MINAGVARHDCPVRRVQSEGTLLHRPRQRKGRRCALRALGLVRTGKSRWTDDEWLVNRLRDDEVPELGVRRLRLFALYQDRADAGGGTGIETANQGRH